MAPSLESTILKSGKDTLQVGAYFNRVSLSKVLQILMHFYATQEYSAEDSTRKLLKSVLISSFRIYQQLSGYTPLFDAMAIKC